ncbi:MAG: DUF4118 domain-containing protein [Acidobacteriaceae bacterium]|nr:DUF4118 domain-containing protein [Acidobacteriaceae bacterium]
MTRAKPALSNIPSVVLRYGLAMMSVGGALAIGRFLFSEKVEGVEFPLFLIATTLTVWYGGVGPAILALVLSTLSFNYYFTRPYYSFYVARADLPYYLVFVLFALLITWFSALRRLITYWNRGAHELYGWAPEQAIGKQSNYLLQTAFPVPLDEIQTELLRAGR